MKSKTLLVCIALALCICVVLLVALLASQQKKDIDYYETRWGKAVIEADAISVAPWREGTQGRDNEIEMRGCRTPQQGSRRGRSFLAFAKPGALRLMMEKFLDNPQRWTAVEDYFAIVPTERCLILELDGDAVVSARVLDLPFYYLSP